MSRKVYVKLEVNLIMLVDDDTQVADVIDNMDYNFNASDDDNATITDSEVIDFQITDVK